ncbi:MAG: hypothetical protein H7289_07715 [Mucilaginibacter sp.]|nr:hypothetical protein [Mucilaginibacter sp.]
MYSQILAHQLNTLMYAIKGKPVVVQFSADIILNNVCLGLGVSRVQMASKTQIRTIADARCIASYLMRKYTQLTLKEITKAVGLRNHATIIYQIGKYDTLMGNQDFTKKRTAVLERMGLCG